MNLLVWNYNIACNFLAQSIDPQHLSHNLLLFSLRIRYILALYRHYSIADQQGRRYQWRDYPRGSNYNMRATS